MLRTPPRHHPAGTAALAALLPLLAPSAGHGVETQVRSWRAIQEFAPGEMDHVSVSPEGRLVLSPGYRRLAELDEPVAWAIGVASGGLVVATGHDGRVLRVPPDGGKPTVLLDTDELEVSALAVGRDGAVYAGTSPDGKVYRVPPKGGDAQVVFDPEERYIWALAPAADGGLYVATGDKGAVYRVEPDGRHAAVLTAEETHILALALAADGTLYAGSGGNGYVYKVEKGGRTTILVDTAGSEVKALLLDGAGNLFAASTGRPTGGPEAPGLGETLGAAASTSAALDDGGGSGPADITAAGAAAVAPAPIVAQAPQPQASPTPSPQIPVQNAPPPPYMPSGPRQSWLYRIRPDGLPEEIWRSTAETIHSMALFHGAVALGTGDEGKVLLVDAKTGAASILLDFPGAQVTGLAVRGDGLAVATSNLASVWAVDGAPAGQGTYTSPVVDAGAFATWGRILVRASGTVRVATRSGNTEKPGPRWSSWEDAAAGIHSPRGRYVQYRLTLASGSGAGTAEPKAASGPDGDGAGSAHGAAGEAGTKGARAEVRGARGPEVREVQLAFLPHNLAPRIRSVTVLDPHVELVSSASPPPGLAGQTPTRIPPPPRNRTRPAPPDLKPAPREQETYGVRSARWEAEDPNGDDLRYVVSVRGEGEETWKPLAKDLDEPFVAFDATSLPDGVYTLRVQASDRAANPDDRALTAELVSEPFVIDNTAPHVEIVETRREAGSLHVRVRVADRTSLLQWAEYAIDGGPWRPVLPADDVFDQLEETLDFTVAGVSPGEHTVAVRAEDTGRNVGSAKAVVR